MAPDARYGPYPQPHKLVFANLTWRDLEPQKGVFDYKKIENLYKFQYWKDHDVKLIVRLVLDYPSTKSHLDIPDWLYNEIYKDGTYYDVDWGKGFSPNYSNKTLIYYHKLLINSFAKRYAKDNFIAFIELGSIGHWGEWHTKQDSETYIAFPSANITDQYTNHYISSLPNKKLLMRRPFKIARNNNFGLYNDMFGSESHTTDEYLSWINTGYTCWLTKSKMPNMMNFWKTAPSGGEFANGVNGISYLEDDKIENTLSQARATHISWLGPNCFASHKLDENQQTNLNRLLNTMGYRFSITSAKFQNPIVSGGINEIRFEVINSGSAPFYYSWPLELYVVNSKGNIIIRKRSNINISAWLPGKKNFIEKLVVPSRLPNDNYIVCLAILDPVTLKPGIELAMEGRRLDGSYQVANFSIR